MSSKCDKCLKYCLDCKCPIIRERKWVNKEDLLTHLPESKDGGITVKLKHCCGLKSLQKAFDELDDSRLSES